MRHEKKKTNREERGKKTRKIKDFCGGGKVIIAMSSTINGEETTAGPPAAKSTAPVLESLSWIH